MSRDHARDARQDSLTRAHEQLTAAVEALVEGDAWRRMLEVAARLPRYSPSNVLLISVQRPDASAVAGLRTWNSLGRRIRKGERRIAILAPCTYRPDSAMPDTMSPASPVGQPEPAATARVLRGFRVVHVFDIAQTDGMPLPEVTPEPLTGPAPAQLWQRLLHVTEADGYRVERGPCAGAYGLTSFTDRLVRVRDDVEPPQACKTLAHELGHIRAEHETRFADYHRSSLCRGAAEVEAESIAYVVAAAAGLDSARYTVPYLAHWAGGDTGVLRESAYRVISSAKQILVDTDALPPDTIPASPAAWRQPATASITPTAEPAPAASR